MVRGSDVLFGSPMLLRAFMLVVRIYRFAPLGSLLMDQIILTFECVKKAKRAMLWDSNVRFDPLGMLHGPALSPTARIDCRCHRQRDDRAEI